MKRHLIKSVLPLFFAVSFFAPTTPAAARSAEKDTKPEVWIHHGNWRAFVADGAKWDFVRKHVDGFQFFIGSIPKETSKNAKDFRALIKKLKKNDIDVSVELGGVLTLSDLNNTVGERSAKIDLKSLNRLAEFGAKIDYLNLDGPIRRLMNDPLDSHREPVASLDEAVTQMVKSMQTTRKTFPKIEFFYLSNFPNYGYKGGPSYTTLHGRTDGWGDFRVVAEAAIRGARNAGVPLKGITADDPYDYLMGERQTNKKYLADPKSVDWMARLRDLEEYVESEGLDFNLIVNTQRGGDQSDELFYKDTLAFVDAYLAAGGSPKRWIVESWYKHPINVVPETDSYTMTALVKEVIKRVKGISE